MSEISIIVGNNIRWRRTSLGISLEDLAFRAQLNAAHLGQIERGMQNPTIETLDRIAMTLGIPVNSLFANLEERLQEQLAENDVRKKIDAQLSALSLDEQKDVLQLIKIYRRYPRNNTDN